ncbi:uncharacterized protein B0H18DRAFT_974276, partial [Fomitopsis serialis]|uniref:uncharacterized protein n=1 Tax=Fomitopsis serialis TaxID=139415 RepID=UPI002007C75E
MYSPSASHALRGSSKYHVFRSITIDGLEVLNRFCQLVCTSPDIASLVQELYFNTYRHFMRQETFIWIHHTAAFPVNRLTRLKTVGFSYVRFGHLAEYPVMPAFYQNLTRYRGVRELRISSCDFEHMDALEDFIWRFAPQSEQTHTRAPAPPFALTLDCVTWGIPERITPSRADLCLTSLTIDNYSMPDLITMWLLRTPSPMYCGRWELDRVGTFLRSLGN